MATTSGRDWIFTHAFSQSSFKTYEKNGLARRDTEELPYVRRPSAPKDEFRQGTGAAALVEIPRIKPLRSEMVISEDKGISYRTPDSMQSDTLLPGNASGQPTTSAVMA
jgi:hypothetical protein